MSSKLLKYLGILILASALILVFAYSSLQNFLKVDINTPPGATGTPTSQSVSGIEIAYASKTYSFDYFFVTDLNRLTLIPNFDNPLTSKEIIQKNNCQAATNAGFYTTNRRPVGLFSIADTKLADAKQSNLFDVNLVKMGNQLWFNQLNQNTSGDFAIQIGPRLIKDSQELKLNINNDKYARRIVVTKTVNDEVLFLVIFDPDSVYKGPMLADLPQILQLIEQNLNIKFKDAANLDGGSASMFYSPDVDLTELSLIGSLFCVSD